VVRRPLIPHPEVTPMAATDPDAEYAADDDANQPVAALPVDAGGAEPMMDEPLPEVPLVKLGFWQRPMVQNVLPLGTSIAVHLGIVAVAVAGFSTYQVYKQTVEEQIIIPEAAIIEGADVGGIPNPGLGGDPTRSAAQDQIPEAQSEGWAEKPSETLQVAVIGGGGASEQQADTVIGIGGAGSLARGTGTGAAGGTGSGDGSGQLAPFGVPGGGGGMGPRASFVGVSGNARRVVYICDATGTMIGLKFKLLQKQLYKAIDVLGSTQGFNVIFFRGGDSDAEWNQPFARELVMAKPDNKQKVRQFIENFGVVGKGTNPLPALRTAFQQRPQLIYFLSDGEFNNYVGYEQVLSEVRRLNADKSVKINTIAFMSEDIKAEQALEQMAQENGGKFVKVTDRDLD
jgi:hypothetical protein